ncbi:efflux RND transporter periplasmic adaptor subunit [Noviherbaspirillum cavernae]|uniref:Efflux RND transporter periplasmic adaptor subunit n=1 Tax=Noviherbaspirillum cavernae TaxID=2320862 RepID=A0A418WYU5_9BURK|nr:efflux RND transporter periplasmic adaptor subunit [Noviherbaspirillum cavernae]RJG05410.1 efflux RND transporter periplasmic adaptor subunit [Noviherbaspirillum cavernae]
MKSASTLKAVKAVALLFAGAGLAFGGYWTGMHKSAGDAPPSSAVADKIDPATGRKVLYWHDPMVPGHKFDKPGKSPFMDMQLVPVYADEAAADGVKINPSLQQNLGIRFAAVRREDARDSFEMVGTTQFDESVAEVVQSRVTGYIERLHARAPMQRVKRGEPIASLFVLDWIAPQEEYLALKRAGNNDLAAAARQRMRALSIPDGLVAQAERTGQAQKHFTITSPVTGVITELAVRDGAMVSPGVTIAKVAGLQKLWLIAEVPELLATSVRPAMTVEATFAGDPSHKYSGKVREVLPGVSTATRTVQARLELDNRDGKLTPGMLMRVRLGAEQSVSRLLVPTEAVITTGKRSVVLVAGDNNSMQPVTVTTGRDISGDTEILSGLSEGQRVVASGQFLIDSEASLKAVLPRLAVAQANAQAAGTSASPSSPKASSAPAYHGVGKVERIDKDAFTISHQPIPALQWGAMTMGFKKQRPDAFPDIKVGQSVEFSFTQANDDYVLVEVKPASGGAK